MSTKRVKLPILYKRTNTGATQSWGIAYSETPEGWGSVTTTFGQVGTEQPQVTNDIIKVGKNIGRANATSPYEQAKAEAQAKFDKKKKTGYTEDIDQAKSGDKGLPGITPMLAHPWEKQGKSMPFPCMVQPKLDGLRAICVISDGKANFFSRTQKPFHTVPHLVLQMEHLARINGIKEAIFDGELYSDLYKDNFNEIVSRVKRDEVHPDAKMIDYHIYDLPSQSNAPFEGRNTTLRGYFQGTIGDENLDNLVVVQTDIAENIESLKTAFAGFLGLGYEGLMARDPDSKYENKRSKGLLKYKLMQDDEFKVVGVDEGKGKLMGHAGSFICETKSGQRFNVKMKGELANLKELFENFEIYRGKMMTVQFFQLTPETGDGKGGIPRFPVGLRFREAE